MTDRDVYLRLTAMAEELEKLAERAESYVGNAALSSSADLLRGTAKAIYDHCLSGEDELH